MGEQMRATRLISIILIVSIISAPVNVSADDQEETFTLTGSVYTGDGQAADRTSIKVDSMDSSWSENGEYVFSGITPGEHTVRAYFMNDGHTVVYRKMVINSDMELDWYEGKNWITAEMFDDSGVHVENSPTSTVKLVEANESHILDDGRTEFGLLDIGQYYTIRAYYGDIDHSTQYIHFKMEAGTPNDFDFNHGMNSRYGFIKNEQGVPIPGVTVSDGVNSINTNSDGFYLLENLEVGTTQTLTFQQESVEIYTPLDEVITDGSGWLNITSDIEVELPGNVSFITTVQTIPMSPFSIEWSGGDFTDYYSLYSGEDLVYRGAAESFSFNPQEAGSFEFSIEATNSNGSTLNLQTLLLIVIPDQSGSDLWSMGMSWNYAVTHTPLSPNGVHNVTLTAIGTESITDAFGRERTAFLTRYSDENHAEGEKSYRWVDSENLLTLHTYWVDAPSESSYYQEGTLGWDLTDDLGMAANLLDADGDLNLHFNRTNVIGVPGHPNGYDDTQNLVSITDDVTITTQAGDFLTKHITITDLNDGVISWELWYNHTVRNWVKIIDKLPGSHSDQVVFELTSFDVPITPQFTTEDANLSIKDYSVEWAVFQGATSYKLLENGVPIYEGVNTLFNLENQADGQYLYSLNAVMASGHVVEGDNLELNVMYVQLPPTVLTPTQTISAGETIEISWEPVENVAWYSVTIQDADGMVTEIYNGTESAVALDDLDTGQNRIRVKVGLSDGKISDMSPSIFVTLQEPSESENNPLNPTIILIVGIVLLLVPIISANWGRNS